MKGKRTHAQRMRKYSETPKEQEQEQVKEVGHSQRHSVD